MPESPSKPSTPTIAALAKTDPLAAIVCLVAFVLSAAGIPSKLGLSPATTSAIGSAVVFTAAAGRGYLRYRKGEEVALQDLFATALGAILFLLSVAGVTNAIALDSDTIAMIGSGLATLAAGQRARKPAV
jgi:hypothetical protein